MGEANYLIEGISGAGKTSVAEELERRGHHVVHGDRTLAYYGDPQTGEALSPAAHLTGLAAIEWGYARWIWPVDRVLALIADKSHAATFFCGGTRNSHHFIHLFDAAFILDLDAATLTRRLEERTDDEFGGKAGEKDFLLRRHGAGTDRAASGILVDATAPVAEVVDTILARCSLGESRS
jgi:thymidylate kinase